MKPEEKARSGNRVVELVAKLSPFSIFPGEWESSMPGSGFDFLQIRPYAHGDDPRKLYFPSLIREGKKKIIDRVAQSQVSIYTYADFSSSMRRDEKLHFFSKAEIRDTLIGLVCLSAAKVYSPLSLCAFAEKVECAFPSVMGDDHAYNIFRWAMERESFSGESNTKAALKHMLGFVKPRSIVFLISDFLGKLDFSDELKKAAAILDLVVILVRSEQEKRLLTLPGSMRFTFEDSRTGKISEIRINNSQRARMRRAWDDHYSALKTVFGATRTEWITVDSHDLCFMRLQEVFIRRGRR